MSKKELQIGDKVKTIVSPFTDKEVRYGVIVYIHPTDVAKYIIDFGETWGGFFKNQIERDL